MKVGLRIDVDTFRGTRDGVRPLCEVLAGRGIRASLFFSVGPDNMGRHVWRLLRPRFLAKMLRSRAASLYGWDILLQGVIRRGPRIGKVLGDALRAAAADGHEIGLHAWDHYDWQAHVETMDAESIYRTLLQGCDLMESILGRPPSCSAAPGWRCTDAVLLAKSRLPFAYNSDCRGRCIFAPVARGEALTQPQVPTTVPTYDEIIGRDGVSDENYNTTILDLLEPVGLNVLTIHAEVEGMARRELFADFLEQADRRGVEFAPLGQLAGQARDLPEGAVVRGLQAGREGWISVQGPDDPRGDPA